MPRYDNNIFLDLDSTCIYSLEAENTTPEQLKTLREHGMTVKDMDGIFWVVERPGLQRFLDFLFANFNVSVWTAATKPYALWIIDEYITPEGSNRNLEYILWSDHCELCQEKYAAETSKDLSVFWRIFNIPGFNQENTLILDDNCVKVWDTQECNCLMIRAFEADEPNCWDDRELIRTQKHLQRFLAGEFPDVCPVGDGMYTTPTEIGEVYGALQDLEEISGPAVAQTEDDFSLHDIEETDVSPDDSVSQIG